MRDRIPVREQTDDRMAELSRIIAAMPKDGRKDRSGRRKDGKHGRAEEREGEK